MRRSSIVRRVLSATVLILALSGAALAQQLPTPRGPVVGQPQRLPDAVLRQRADNNFSGVLRVTTTAPIAAGGALRLQKLVGRVDYDAAFRGGQYVWRLDTAADPTSDEEPAQLNLALRVTAGWRYRLVCDFNGDTLDLSVHDLETANNEHPGLATRHPVAGTATLPAEEFRLSEVRYTWRRHAGVSRLTATLDAVSRDVWREVRFHSRTSTRARAATFYACEVSALS